MTGTAMWAAGIAAWTWLGSATAAEIEAAATAGIENYGSVHAAHRQQFGALTEAEERAHRQKWDLRPRPPHPAPPVASSADQRIIYGYHPYWGDDPTELDFASMTHLAIFDVELNSDGSLSDTHRWTDVAPAVVPLAHAAGVRVHLCAISFDGSVHAALLPSSSRRATAIANLKRLVEDYGADGVNIDIEGLDDSLRDEMVLFLQELDAEVEDVWVATPAVDWSEAWDEAAMSQLSGGMFIMGYGYHWTGGDPGPNDPLYGGGAWSSYSLSKTVQYYIDQGADPKKIVLGLPLYGQEWPSNSQVPGDATGSGWSIVMSEAEQIAAAEGRSYDTTTYSPYVLRSGTQLWYDDNDSVRDRIRWSVGAGIGGIGFWALTYEGDDPAFWDMVREETYVPPDPGGDSGGGGDSGDSGSGDSGSGRDSGNGGDSGGTTGYAPIARAGETVEAAPGDTVILNGSGSADPDGYPLAWEWQMLTGPEIVTLSDADEAAPSFVPPIEGTWRFQLTVRSKNGTSDPDTVDVVVARRGMCSSAPRAPGWLLVAGAAILLARRKDRHGGRHA